MRPLPSSHPARTSHVSDASDASNASATASLPKAGWMRRFGWLILIWCASVAALGIAALVLKMIMRAIGMSS